MSPRKSISSIGSNTKREKSDIGQIDLQKFCFKKLYEIVFINESSVEASNTLDRIIAAGKMFDKISKASFITYEDVMDFIDRFSKKPDQINLPEDLKKRFAIIIEESIIYFTENIPIPLSLFAKIIKMKIVETMYVQYSQAVGKINESKRLEDELTELLTYVPKVEGKKGGKGGKGKKGSKKGDKKDKKSKSKDKDSKTKNVKGNKPKEDTAKVKDEDVTKIPLQQSELISTSNYSNEIWFYILKGFYNPNILEALVNLDVPIDAILEVSVPDNKIPIDTTENEKDKVEQLNIFWSSLNNSLYSHVRSQVLENTILMKYTPVCESSLVGKEVERIWLEQLVDILWQVNDLKLIHMNYIKNLKLNTLEHFGPVHSSLDFKLYNKLLSVYPHECIDVPLIVDALVEEIHFRFEKTAPEGCVSKLPDQDNFSGAKEENVDQNCECLFSFDYFVPFKKNKPNKALRKVCTYETHAHNRLDKIVKSYNEVGKIIYDINLRYLKKIHPAICLELYSEADSKQCQHTHDRPNIGCTELSFTKDEIFYYAVLFALFKLSCNALVPTNAEMSDINENLQMNDVVAEYQKLKPQVINDSTFDVLRQKSHHGKFSGVNLYEMKQAASYNWAEILSTPVMLQELARCNEKYSCLDHVYCDEFDCILIRYHDNFDAFGIKIKVWHESLRTPVCFRDFCRYICNYDIKWLEEEDEKTNIIVEASASEDNLKNKRCEGAKQLAVSASNANYIELLTFDTLEVRENKPKKGMSEEKLTQVMQYPKSELLKELCIKGENQNQIYNGYDLGTQQLEVNGSTTTFQSHDDVRICVDTTHLLGSPKNLSISLSAEGNDFIMHRTQDKNNFVLRIVTSDSTIIAVNVAVLRKFSQTSQNQEDILMSPKTASVTDDMKSTSFDVVSGGAPLTSNSSHVSKTTTPIAKQRSSRELIPKSSNISKALLVTDYNDLDILEEDRTRVFEKHLVIVPKLVDSYEEGIITIKSFIDALDTGKFKMSTEDILRAIFNGINEERLLYKATSNDIKSGVLNKTNDYIRIPLFTIIKRILQKEAKKEKCKRFIRAYVARDDTTANIQNLTSPDIDLRLTLLNGLTITMLPSEICKEYFEVKQAFLLNAHPKNLENEIYRLFTRNGLIVIRYPDGRLDFLKANGEIIQFEKPCNNDQPVSEMKFGVEIKNCFKLPTCKSLYNCQKELNTILLGKYGDNVANHVSRRAYIHRQQAHLEQIEDTTCRLPYCKYSVLKFDGKRIRINNKKITQHQEFFTTHEFDHRLEERFYIRDDGMRSVFEKDGKLTVQFPDKSRITSWYIIEPELIIINKKTGGWVSVLLNFKFEHPSYATVIYIGESKDVEINVNENINIKNTSDGRLEMKLGSQLTATLDAKELQVAKSCESCDSSFICNINLGKFSCSDVNKENDILIAKDTYNKIFRVKDVDYYLINKSYAPGPLNVECCDHYHKMAYEKLFALRRDYSGLLLWNNWKINKRIEYLKNSEGTNVIKQKNIRGFKFVEFTKDIYQPYNERFVNADLCNNVCLSRYQAAEIKPKETAYLLYREVYEMTTINKLVAMLTEIKEFFQERKESNPFLGDMILALVDGIIQNIDEIMFLNDLTLSTSIVEVIDDRPICDCMKLRFTYQEKIEYWRKQCQKYKDYIRTSFVPLYFMSEYYK